MIRFFLKTIVFLLQCIYFLSDAASDVYSLPYTLMLTFNVIQYAENILLLTDGSFEHLLNVIACCSFFQCVEMY